MQSKHVKTCRSMVLRDDVDDELIEPRLTRCDVLKAVSTIKKYIDELDDPVSCKILGPFN